jgi:hypothetical protein
MKMADSPRGWASRARQREWASAWLMLAVVVPTVSGTRWVRIRQGCVMLSRERGFVTGMLRAHRTAVAVVRVYLWLWLPSVAQMSGERSVLAMCSSRRRGCGGVSGSRVEAAVLCSRGGGGNGESGEVSARRVVQRKWRASSCGVVRGKTVSGCTSRW